MIQDISPDRLDNTFAHRVSTAEDRILLFDSDGNCMSKRWMEGSVLPPGEKSRRTERSICSR